MKKAVWLLVLGLLMGGCQSSHYKEVEGKALKYYRDKYGLKDIEIKDSYKAGDPGLFGYLDVKDRAYELSDGHSIYWDDDEGYFADDRQATAINEAFAEYLPDILNDPHVLLNSKPELNRTAKESYDRCVFTECYAGDLLSFLSKEQPKAYRLNVYLQAEEGFDHEKWCERLYQELDDKLDGYLSVYVLDDPSLIEDQDPSEIWLSATDEGIRAAVTFNFGQGISWYRQIYAAAGKGVFVMAAKENFDLQEGDIILEEAGPARELQELIDAAYEELPLDAEENKNGGYIVHDRRHERKTVLDDQDRPYYRLRLSERVKEAMSGGSLSVYVKLQEQEETLHARYVSSGYHIYAAAAPDGKAHYHNLKEDTFYYFGTYHYEEYEER